MRIYKPAWTCGRCHTDKRDDNMIVLSEAYIQAIGEEDFRLLDKALHECGMKKSTHYN